MPDTSKQIIKAAKVGDTERVKGLVAIEANLIHARDSDGSTPLEFFNQ